MTKLLIPAALATGAMIGGFRRFRHDMSCARQRVSRVLRAVTDTTFGAIEYADVGSADAAAQRIPRARLVAHPRGGHLMLGQHDATRSAVLNFVSSIARELPLDA